MDYRTDTDQGTTKGLAPTLNSPLSGSLNFSELFLAKNGSKSPKSYRRLTSEFKMPEDIPNNRGILFSGSASKRQISHITYYSFSV